jgi:hypothetical protein
MPDEGSPGLLPPEELSRLIEMGMIKRNRLSSNKKTSES